ncbi:MAG: hypothetical protein QXF01_00240 [Candidatus Micrarchaeaceae archaeon]
MSEERGPEAQAHQHQHRHSHMNSRIIDSAKRYVAGESFRLYAGVLLAYALVTLVMFWYVTININSAVAGFGGDVYQTMWDLWWAPYSVFYLHSNPYFTNILFYPIGANLATQDLSPLAGIMSAPLQAIGLPFAYNVIFMLGFVLSGLFAFMLLMQLTGNKYASFIGSLVFAFSPMHTAQAIGHLNWASIEFVPLFLLLFMLMVKEKKLRYSIGCAITFLLLVFFGDPQQGLMLSVFVALLALVYMILRRKESLKLLDRKLALNFAAMVAIVAVLGSPFFIPIFEAMLSPTMQASISQLSGLSNQLLYSNNLLSFFLPSYYNGIFHSLSKLYFNSIYGLVYNNQAYKPDVTEKVSYLGYSVIFLALAAVYIDLKKHRLRNTALWIVLFLIFAWLSLGPLVQVSGAVTPIPGIYELYSHIPVLNIIREPGRFDMMATLCLAVLAAMGFAYITEGRDKKSKMAFTLAFFALIMVEYNAMPLSSSFAASITSNATIPKAYHQIGQLQGNFTVLTLPIVIDNNLSSPELYPALAMYYDTAMNGKPIVGGYTSRENATQIQASEAIPLASAAAYLEQGYGLVYPSPVLGNFTNDTLLWLAIYNTQFITVTRSAYSIPEQKVLYNYLYDVFGTPLYISNSTFVFGTKNAVLKNEGRAFTAYSVGTWIPGYEFCNGYACNASFGTLWWGSNERGITIYAPNASRVTMNMTAEAAFNNTVLYYYLNQQQLGELRLRNVTSNYSISFNVSAGLSQLVLFAQNSTALPSQYLGYGIKNITFSEDTNAK